MLRNREGFTLIELLIVVVIIGILAAIALPKFGQTRERAYVSSMQSDLRNLQTAQEMYYTEWYVYRQSGTMDWQNPDTDLDFQPSAGVTITLGANGLAPGEGFQATATHTAMPSGYDCVVTVGGAAGTTQSIVCN